MEEAAYQKHLEIYQTFPNRFSSVILATVGEDSLPQASYAPCIVDQDRNIYIFVSGLSAHTQNLTTTGKVSALFIEDESQTPQMFARRRLSYDCSAVLVDRENSTWSLIAEQFSARFGNIIEVMKGLSDFRIFQLCPYGGRFVVGFGAIYDVDPKRPDLLLQRGKG